jgi:tetratricopeptide (TPR) repeat protein
LEIAKQIGDIHTESASYVNLGAAFLNLSDYTRAIEFHEKALEIAKQIDDPSIESFANLGLALCYFHNYSNPDELENAYNYCKQSLELVESIGGKLVEEEHKIGFYSLRYNSYDLMVQICLRLKKEEEAFEYVERSQRHFLI